MGCPCLILASCLASGIWLADLGALPASAAAAGLAIALASAWALYLLKRNAASFAALVAATAFLGAGLFAAATARYEQNGLRRLAEAVYGDFTGTLTQTPSPALDRDFLFLRVDEVDIRGVRSRLAGNLRVSVPRSAEFPTSLPFKAGDRLKVSAQILPVREYRNFREPFTRMYLKTQLLHNLATTKSPLLVEKIGSAPRASPPALVSALRLRFQRTLERDFASTASPSGLTPEGAILETLLLGGRGRLTPETTSAMQKTGLYHLLAISGAHIGVISFLIFGLFRALRVPRRASCILLIALLVLYELLVEGRASVLRAVIMSIGFLLGKLLEKDSSLLNGIGASAFALLLANPFQLFELGFQLTFAATLAIILFTLRITAALPTLPLRIGETFAMSLSAQAGVMPLIALAFNRIIFSGLLLNFIGIPLVGLIMAVGYVYLPVAVAVPGAAPPLAAALAFLTKVFMLSTHLLDRWDFFSYRIPTPPAAVAAGYFVCLLFLLLPAKLRKARAFAAAGFALFFATLITYPFSSASRDLKVTFIDVGQGDSILVELPGRKKMLIDGGGLPTGAFDVGESVVAPFLWSKGIKRIDVLVLTHGHSDHLYGLPSIAADFRIGEFWEADSPPMDPVYEKLKASLRGTAQARAFRGFSRREGGVEIDALSPPPGGPPASPADNDRSLALRIAYGQASFLLTGDIGADAERGILASGPADLRSLVFKSPHHGSRGSSSPEFLAAAAPRVVVISVGGGNRYGFPHPDVLARYAVAGAAVFRTDLDGAVELSSDGNRIAVRTAVRRPREAGADAGLTWGPPGLIMEKRRRP
jgi:competence protein ComEC